MAENCKLSEGSKSLLSILEGEPKVKGFRNVDPAVADELDKMIDDAFCYTRKQMPWLSGIYINLDDLHKISSLVGKIRSMLVEGREYEDRFWKGVEDSASARNGFVKALLGAVESGSVVFKGKEEAE